MYYVGVGMRSKGFNEMGCGLGNIINWIDFRDVYDVRLRFGLVHLIFILRVLTFLIKVGMNLRSDR